MYNPLISVIVPVYKVEDYLDRCVQSIVNQTYRNLEIILVDDGSPDNCGVRCDDWAKKDKRIKVIHKQNGGLSSARNAGLDIFSGEYVTFVDSDDWIEEDYYELVFSLMISHDAQIGCVGRYDVNCETMSRKVGLCPTKQELLSRNEMLKRMLTWRGCDFSACDKLFAASLWNGIRFPVGKTSEDVGSLYRVVGNAERIILCPVVGYNYFHRKGSITDINRARKNTHIVQFADEICTYARTYFPDIVVEADYFKLKTLLYWNRAYMIQPDNVKEHKQLCHNSRAWFWERFGFILFCCPYVRWKDKVWYLLILTKMSYVIRWLAMKKS